MHLLLAPCLALLAAPSPPSVPAAGGPPPNILVVIADDLGVDKVGAYGEHPDPALTPTIDALAAQGMMFRNAWAYDTCSPTRAAMLTGRHARRTGIGTFILTQIADVDLPETEVSLADVLAATGYRTAAVGKWHLSAALSATDWYQHPLLMGFEHHWGPITNFVEPFDTYDDYDKNVDGTIVRSTEYATTEQVDDTLELIESFGSEPWFVWLAFNAPHRPLHVPPAHLHSYTLVEGDFPSGVTETARRAAPGPGGGAVPGQAGAPGPATKTPPLGIDTSPIDEDPNAPVYVSAMTQAMDTELGRLLASMDPAVLANTYVIFVGDNGTNGQAISTPWDPAKGKSTLFEGGINVPLVVTGPGVAAGVESPALVHVVDLFATVADLAGADASTAVDSTSFALHLAQPALPTANVTYTERFRPNGFGPYQIYQQVARNQRFKYWRLYQGSVFIGERLYDLANDPFETNDLLLSPPLLPGAEASYQTLQAYMDALD